MESLRERKKARVRAELQEHALRLFGEQGFDATTVDDIAAAAEVSRSTFFRYFGTKEDVVLFDTIDPVFLATLASQPPGMPLLDALIGSIRHAFDSLDGSRREQEELRMALIRTNPGVARAQRSREAWQVEEVAQVISSVTGKHAHDPDVLLFAGVFTGVRLAAQAMIVDDPGPGYVETTLQMLEGLQGGIPLLAAPIHGPATYHATK